MSETDTISVILTVYNQENIIERVFTGIANNISYHTKEIIIIYDGCTDSSEENLAKIYHRVSIPLVIIHTPDLNETKANNVGLKASKYKYSIIVQDDCMIMEKNFDIRLLKPFKLIPNLLGVSGRDAVDIRILNERVDFYNVGGADVRTSKNIFSIRDAVNRGPLMLDNEKLKQLNYLDEAYAPFTIDDVDLSVRGYKEFGYLVGSYVIDFSSPLQWGKTRSDFNSNQKFEKAEAKNLRLLVTRHKDFILGEKHSRDIVIP